MTSPPVPAGVDADDPAYVANPVTGERFRFHTRPDDPATDPLAFDLWAPPDMTPLAEHVHPKQDEVFTVESGRLELDREGSTETVEEGESATVPAGTPHQWSTAGDDELHLAVRFEPGLRSEDFLRDLAALADRGEVGANGAPSLLQIAAMYDSYGFGLLHIASPPLRVQRAVFGVLGPTAKLLGYRANPVEGRDGT